MYFFKDLVMTSNDFVDSTRKNRYAGWTKKNLSVEFTGAGKINTKKNCKT